MSCKICGRGGCTESFHSLADQARAEVLAACGHKEEIESLAAEVKRLMAILSHVRETDRMLAEAEVERGRRKP